MLRHAEEIIDIMCVKGYLKGCGLSCICILSNGTTQICKELRVLMNSKNGGS